MTGGGLPKQVGDQAQQHLRNVLAYCLDVPVVGCPEVFIQVTMSGVSLHASSTKKLSAGLGRKLLNWIGLFAHAAR
jgi:hypothetical protein